MKHFKYITASLLCVSCFTLTGCSLDEDPLYTPNNKLMFSKEETIEQALAGCYSYLATDDTYGQRWQEFPVMISGMSWVKHRGGSEDDAVTLAMTAGNTQAGLCWNGMYKVIAETNAFIESAANSPIEDGIKYQKILEARFLRGLAYFNLVNMFGDIPLKQTASTSDGISIPRTPAAQVYDFIIKDFEAATGLTRDHVDGRADALAAKAYLCKVYHKMACLGIDPQQNLTKAKNLFEAEVKGKYQLQPKFDDLFVNQVRGSKESIFQVNFDVNSQVNRNRGTNRLAPDNSTTGVTWGTFRSSKMAYELMRSTHPGDPRIEATFLSRWRACQNHNGPKPIVGDELSANDSVYAYPYMTYTIKDEYIYKNGNKVKDKQFVSMVPYDLLTTPENPKPEELEALGAKAEDTEDKFEKARLESYAGMLGRFAGANNVAAGPWHNKQFDPLQQGNRSHKNLIVFRYAELLLIMADVYNELDQKDKAVALVNEVLTRARNSQAGAVEPRDWKVSDFTSKEDLTEAIYFESVIEMMSEPCIFEVTRLKGTKYLGKLLEKHNANHLTKLSDQKFSETHHEDLELVFNNGNITEDFLKKNLLAPIPENEIKYNEALTEADNNFGY